MPRKTIKPDTVPPIGSKPRYSLRETAALLGISERRVREHIAHGHINTVRDGVRRFVLDPEVRRIAETSL